MSPSNHLQSEHVDTETGNSWTDHQNAHESHGSDINLSDIIWTDGLGTTSFSRTNSFTLGKDQHASSNETSMTHFDWGILRKAKFKSFHSVIVKCINTVKIPDRTIKFIKSEAITLSKFSHPQIAKIWGMLHDEKTSLTAVVIEDVLEGDLNTYYQINEIPEVSQRVRIAMDIVSAMLYLSHQSPPMVHRNLSSYSVLIFHDKSAVAAVPEESPMGSFPKLVENYIIRAKVTDFGLLNLSTRTSSNLESFIWIAPEFQGVSALGREYTAECDIFSFAVILTELLTWKGPYGIPASQIASQASSLLPNIQKFLIPPFKIPRDVPVVLHHLATACLKPPGSRPNFRDIFLKLDSCLKFCGVVNRSKSNTISSFRSGSHEAKDHPAIILKQPPAAVSRSYTREEKSESSLVSVSSKHMLLKKVLNQEEELALADKNKRKFCTLPIAIMVGTFSVLFVILGLILWLKK